MKINHSLMHNNITKKDMSAVKKLLNKKKIILTQSQKVKEFENSLLSYMDSEYEDLMKDITASGRYDDETEKSFKEALDKFVKTQSW